MKNLNIAVVNNKATYLQRDGVIVCGNSSYTVTFAFDSEWSAYYTKTARFKWNGVVHDVVFQGNVVDVPKITNATQVEVGVFAGDLEVTTPAIIPCVKSILCEDGMPDDPSPDVYSQILEKINGGVLQGAPGVGISDVSLNNDNLVVTLTDGTVLDLGYVKGANGKSAYQIAQDNGFDGTEDAWLESLKGGPIGPQGIQGKSAYAIACEKGFEGTEQEWLDYLNGFTKLILTTDGDVMRLFVGTKEKYEAYVELNGEEGLIAFITNDNAPTKEDIELSIDTINNTLTCHYTVEPYDVTGIKKGYKNSFPVGCFNREPREGEKFSCFGRTRKDFISFHMVAIVTNPKNDSGYTEFEAEEVVFVTPLQAISVMESQWPMTVFKVGYTNSWRYDQFNRVPIILNPNTAVPLDPYKDIDVTGGDGEKFTCIGRSGDGITFQMTAKITNYAIKDGVYYAGYEALEVIPLTTLMVIASIKITADITIDDIINDGYSGLLLLEQFNRTPIKGEYFQCFAMTEKDSRCMHITAQIDGFESQDDKEYAVYKVVDVSPVVGVERANTLVINYGSALINDDGYVYLNTDASSGIGEVYIVSMLLEAGGTMQTMIVQGESTGIGVHSIPSQAGYYCRFYGTSSGGRLAFYDSSGAQVTPVQVKIRRI